MLAAVIRPNIAPNIIVTTRANISNPAIFE